MSRAAVARLLTDGKVGWHGTDLGLAPQLSDSDERLVKALDEEDIPVLLDALDSEATFVTAHVLLTRLTGVPHETAPSWNGLVIDIGPDGSTHVDPAQRPAIVDLWRRWLATSGS